MEIGRKSWGGGTVPPFSNAPFYIGKFPLNFVRSAPFSIGKVPLPLFTSDKCPFNFDTLPFSFDKFPFSFAISAPFLLLRSAPSPLIIALFKFERCPY